MRSHSLSPQRAKNGIHTLKAQRTKSPAGFPCQAKQYQSAFSNKDGNFALYRRGISAHRISVHLGPPDFEASPYAPQNTPENASGTPLERESISPGAL